MNGHKYFGLTPTQLNLAFFAVLAALAVGGVFAAGGPHVLDEAKSTLGLDKPKAEYVVGAQASPTPEQAAAPEIGPEVVWDALRSDDLWDALVTCEQDDRECLASVMLSYGARPEAVAFHKETGLFALSFQEAGKVDVVVTFDPRRANSTNDTVLVNGSPRIVVVDDIDTSSLVEHPSYAEIASKVSDFIVWYRDSGLTETATLPSGGQTFLFSVPLADGCHACVIGTGHVSFDFAADGTYQGWRALEPDDTPRLRCRDEGYLEGLSGTPLLLCYEECGSYLLQSWDESARVYTLDCVTECPPEEPYTAYHEGDRYMPAGTHCLSWQP
ncbi:MAG: hypothetical protein Q7R32_14705 [Dehalococcoidia bacterium]|nr:hypothetical protein [Dehalococcoidia bacterium]